MSFYIDIDGQRLVCPEGKTVLLAMKHQGKELLKIGCCSGGCGVCKVRVIEGSYETKVMSRAQVSQEEESQGIALACRILPSSDLKIELIK